MVKTNFYFKLWIVCFLYAALVALSLQKIFLPYVIPWLYAGHDLLVGGDLLMFHELAVDLANDIRQQGWSAWDGSYGRSVMRQPV